MFPWNQHQTNEKESTATPTAEDHEAVAGDIALVYLLRQRNKLKERRQEISAATPPADPSESAHE